MPNTRILAWLCVVVPTMLTASLGAQTSVSVEPLVGYYRPLGHFESAPVDVRPLPSQPQGLSALAFGGEARAWFNGWLGASIEASIAPSHTAAPPPPTEGTGTSAMDARVETVVAQALVSLPPSLHEHLWMSAGLGAVRHAGESYATYGSPTEVAGALGVGASADVNEHVALTGGVTLLGYMLNVPMPAALRQTYAGSIERGRQVDATFRVGVEWFLIRRGE
jgi:hypothetical protein